MPHDLRLAALGLIAALALPAAAAAQALTTNPAEVPAGTYKLDPNHGKITWSVSHHGYSTYLGQFAHVEATLKLDPKTPGATALDATVDTGSVGTFVPELDGQLKSPRFLDVAKFPTATFHATKVNVTGAKTADIVGDLTLHGVTLPVTMQAVFNQAGPDNRGYVVGFTGQAKVKRSDFGIKTFVPVISDEVVLTLEAEFVSKPAA